MININLLPIERKEKNKVLKRNLGFLIFCLSILVVVGIISVVLIAVKFTLRANLDGLNNNISTSKAALRPYDETKNKILFIKDRLSEIAKSEKQRTTWQTNLDWLAKTVPSDIQLTNFSINIEDTSKPSVKISGWAQSEQQIIVFKEQLEASSAFKDILFDSSKRITFEDKEYISFVLFANLEEEKNE